MDSGTKSTNPKDVVGVRKAPITTVPMTVIAEVGVAMLEGARKYGRHNYRVDDATASVYIDAAFRHLSKWWDACEDLDPDSGISHVTKAIASLVVLRDAMICDNFVDDRPVPCPSKFLHSLNKISSDVIDRYPNAKKPHLNVEKK